jgi:hypothetical protein
LKIAEGSKVGMGLKEEEANDRAGGEGPLK